MQQLDHPAKTDASPVTPVDSKPHGLPMTDLLPEARRYLMMRPVLFGALILLLLLHLVAPNAVDLATLLLVAGIYLIVIGSGGLEMARLSGSGGDQRRQERLAEDALRRAGRLQSHLDPCTAVDDVVNRILASGNDPRRMVILAGNEVEDALRAVYRHFSEAERMAGTSNGTDLPLTFLVQELIWRGLLSPDIFDTAEPILSMREIALAPRAQIEPRIAGDIARATQAVVLRVQSLGIEIHPRRVPLAWMRTEAEPEPAEAEPASTEAEPEHDADRAGDEAQATEEGQIVDGDHIEMPMLKESVVREVARRETRRQAPPDSTDTLP